MKHLDMIHLFSLMLIKLYGWNMQEALCYTTVFDWYNTVILSL